MNLCNNAYHAMRDSGGTLSIGLTEHHRTGLEVAPDDLGTADRYAGIRKFIQKPVTGVELLKGHP